MTADLCFGLGRAQAATLDTEAHENLRMAFEFYERRNLHEKMVKVATLPFTWPSTGEGHQWMEDACERCLEIVADESPLFARLLAKIARPRYEQARCEYGEACQIIERACRIANDHDDRSIEIRALANWGMMAWQANRYQEAKEVGTRALKLARRFGDLHGEVIALTSIAQAMSRLGDPDGFRYFEEAVAAAERLRNHSELFRILDSAVNAAMKQAKFARARELFELLAQARRSASMQTRFMAIAYETGDIEAAHESVNQLLSAFGDDAINVYGIGHLCQWALRSADSWLLERIRSLQMRNQEAWEHTTEAEAAMWRGQALLSIVTKDTEAASNLYASGIEAFEDDASRNWYLALLARTAGSLDEAIHWFEQASLRFRVTLEPLHEHWISYFWAETLLMRQAKGDSERARVHLEGTISATQECGMILCERRSRQLLQTIPAKIEDSNGPRAPDGLTVREVEVLRLVAKGLTNNEIGEELCVGSA